MTTATLREQRNVAKEVGQLVKEEFVQHYDANLTADRLADSLTPEQVRYCVHLGLKELADAVRRKARQSNVNNSNRSERLEAARVARDLDSILVWVGDEAQKPLRDCTIADFRLSMDAYLRQIGSLEAEVTRRDKITKAMRKHKAEVAGDLPEELLERLWFDA